MRKKLKTNIANFYNTNPEFITSPFTYTGQINDRGKDLFKEISLKGKDILEVGCGFGHVLSYCKKRGANCWGIDISVEAIKKARKNNKKINYFVEDIENLKHINKNKKFDIILAFEVIEHTIDYKKTFQIINNHLSDEGILILSCPNYFNVCGLVKLISELFIGKNKWAPFAEWKREENEKFITYLQMKKEIEKNFKLKSIETIDMLRGIFPFFYLKYSWEKNELIKLIKRFLEKRRKNIILKYFGSNMIIKASKNENG